MCAYHSYNPLPYFILKVCCDDAGVHAHHNEKPKSIRRGTITIPKGLGFRMKTASAGVSRILRTVMAVVSSIERYSDRAVQPINILQQLKRG